MIVHICDCLLWVTTNQGKMKVRFTAQRKSISYCGTKTEGGIVLPGHYPQVTKEQMECDNCDKKKYRIDGKGNEGE